MVTRRTADGKKCILMLDNIQALAKRGPVWNALREVLNRDAQGLTFGRFIYYEGESDEEASATVAAFELTNYDQVLIHPLNDEETWLFLEHHSMPYWEEQGFIFENNAFEHLFALKAGARSSGRRIANPFLAVEIGRATVRTAKTGAPVLKANAGEAWEALKQLRKTMPPARLQPYKQVLDEASAEINKVHENGKLEERNGKQVLTRAHVTTQLFCGAFAFDPPHPPKKHR
jgi:hypothetical protein